MSLFIDLKFTNLIANRLDRFTRKEDYLFNFRCPVCGDSKKNKTKARGYIYRKTNGLFFRCHNCQASMSIGSFVKHLDPNLYQEYIFERYKNGENGFSNYQKPKIEIPTVKFDKMEKSKTFEHAEWCDKLSHEHFAYRYLESRSLPKEFYSKLLFTQKYKKFVDALIPNHGKELVDDARIVIPFYDSYNELIAVSGRALENAAQKLRYITIRTNDDTKKLVYGMDRIDITKKVYIVEGQFDSMFLPNAIASCDSNLLGASAAIQTSSKVLVFDNEPYNKEIIKLQEKAIKAGENVVIWPDHIRGKDINEMITDQNLSPEKIKTIIDNNTHSDLEALTKFTFWRKA